MTHVSVQYGLSGHNTRVFRWFKVLFGFRPIFAITVLYYVHITGSYGLGMSLCTVATVSAAFLEVPTGVVSDFIGRKKTIIAGTVAVCSAYVMYALASSYWPLAIGAFLEGLSASLFSGNNDALLFESFQQDGKEDDYAGQMGKLNSLSQVAGASGALVSGFIASIAFEYVAWVSALTAGLACIAALYFIEPKIHSDAIPANIFRHLKEAIMHFKRNAKLRNLSLASTLDWGIGGSANVFQPVFIATVWPVWAIGLARVAENVAYAVSGWFSGSILRTVGSERWLFGVSFARVAVKLTAYGFPTAMSPALLVVDDALVAPAHVAQSELMQREFTPRQRATMDSLNSLMGSLFMGICAIGLGYLADAIGVAHSLLVSAILLLPIVFVYSRVLKHSHYARA